MFILHPFSTATCRLVLILVVVGLMRPGGVAAQVVVDVSVMWTSPFEERTDVRTIPDATHETVLVNEGSTVIVANGDLAPGTDRLAALEALDAEPDAIINVEAGTTDEPQYWLDLFAVDGTPYGAFTLARSTSNGVTLTLYMAPVATFAAGMAQAQAAVVVDGAPVFDGVEPTGLQALLEAVVPSLETGDAAAAPATEEVADGNDAFVDQPGMIAEGVYESPHHGFELTWTDEWTFDPAYEAPVASDVNRNFDEVHLTVDSPLLVWFGFYAGEYLPGDSFAEFMDRSSSPSRLELEIGPTAELVVSRVGVGDDGREVGALIIRVRLEGYDFLIYEEYRAGDDGRAVAALQLILYVGDAEAGLDAARSLTFEDGPVITLFTEEEILGASRSPGALEQVTG